MNLKVRTRLTLYFSALFGFLLIASLAIVYIRVTKSLQKEFRTEMIHDGRLLAELFKEELRLGALDEFEHEIEEFDLELLILNEKKIVMAKSGGWDDLKIDINTGGLVSVPKSPVFRELKTGKAPISIFSRSVHIPDQGWFSLHVARSQIDLVRITGKLRLIMIIIAPVMILIGAGAGCFFAIKALSGVEEIRKNADSIYTDDLSARLPIPAQKDELYSLTETLNNMLERIEQSFTRLKNFTADASHELRIPLTALRGHLEVAVRKERSAAEYKEAIQTALEEAEQLSQLTQDLLLLAQSDAGKIKIDRKETDLKKFLEDLAVQAEGLNSDDRVKFEFPPPPEGTVWIDPDRMRQLLLNLIDNAIKYNKPGGTTSVGASLSTDKLTFTVRDTGIGISEEEQKKIFDRFYRVDKARSRQEGGAGLGLSIVRWIAEAHGGEVSVESHNGGTTFIVTVPSPNGTNLPSH